MKTPKVMVVEKLMCYEWKKKQFCTLPSQRHQKTREKDKEPGRFKDPKRGKSYRS